MTGIALVVALRGGEENIATQPPGDKRGAAAPGATLGGYFPLLPLPRM